jgi:hypothetical protein
MINYQLEEFTILLYGNEVGFSSENPTLLLLAEKDYTDFKTALSVYSSIIKMIYNYQENKGKLERLSSSYACSKNKQGLLEVNNLSSDYYNTLLEKLGNVFDIKFSV